jgi:hypothetical protein
MCSSRIDEHGIVTVTTPASWCEVGHRLYTLASAATYGIDHADWCLRLLRPQAPPRGKAWSVGVDTAEAKLKLALRYRLVHESLVAALGNAEAGP